MGKSYTAKLINGINIAKPRKVVNKSTIGTIKPVSVNKHHKKHIKLDNNEKASGTRTLQKSININKVHSDLKTRRVFNIPSKPKPKKEGKKVSMKWDNIVNITYELNKIMLNVPKILYVTSFAEDMYKLTGKKLIESFFTTKQEGFFLICSENTELDEEFILSEKIIEYKLETDDYLNTWLEKHKDIIPENLGGTATEENNPKVFGNKWNILASRWFRKVASINYAFNTHGNQFDYIIWIDSDCQFKDTIPVNLYPTILDGRGMFYYFGQVREDYNSGYETGFLGFNLKEEKGGELLIKMWTDLYEKFIDYDRWDDGYILRIMNESVNQGQIPTIDLCLVNEHSPLDYPNFFYKYISHDKGVHQRKKLMKYTIYDSNNV